MISKEIKILLKLVGKSFCAMFLLINSINAQTLQVKGNSIEIINNDNSPSLTDNTDFGNIPLNTKFARSFVLKNNSGSNLTFTGSSNVTLSGTNASQFSITTRPANNLTLTGFTYTILEVSFNPTSLGIKNANIIITLSSGSPSPYTFAIQGTGIPAVSPEFVMTQLVPNGTFNYPYELIYGPDNYLWLTERVGKKINRVNLADGTVDLLVNLSGLVYQSGGQDGLLGMALHPQLLQSTGNDYIYVAYTYGTSDPTRKTKIVRYTYTQIGNDGTLSAPLELITNLSGSNDHNSGRLEIGPDNKLYYTIGDQGANQFGNKCTSIKAQVLPTQVEIDALDYSSYQGKILRMNLDGTIPSDNPILNSVQSHIFSYGHRNAQGIVFGTNGNLYSNEHGPKSDDEINIIQSGGNYGWPFIAGFRDDKNYAYCNWSSAPTCASLSFSDYTCGTGATSTTESSWAGTFIDPITTLFTIDDGFNFTGGWLTWPTIGPSSIINYEGYSSPIPGWNNSLLSTTLKKGKIYRSILSGDGNSIIGNPEEILYTQNRYRDIAIDPNGKVLYVITDSGGTTSGPSGSSSLSVVNPGTILIFTHETFLNNETHESNPRNIIVYKNNSELKINSGEAIMSAIKIFDITGRLLFEENNIRSNNKTINKFVPTNNLLLIQVQTINNIQISKKVIF
ncbi:MAG: glucose/sorbosone family PQQ-dependent dehydrogenase [Flavobacterium sp.]|jgi:PQQ-dependent dehydrogenase (s-GDH family)